MKQQAFIGTKPNASVRVGNSVYLGISYVFKTLDDETGLVGQYSILHPNRVVLVDNNKYQPHQSTREMSRRKKQLNG